MRKDGWVFDASVPCMGPGVETGESGGMAPFVEVDYASFIGRRARRNFRGFGLSDGKITAYLPPSASEDGSVGFHMEHDDGDAEDLDLSIAVLATRAAAEGWSATDKRLPPVGEDESDDESDTSSVPDEEVRTEIVRGAVPCFHTVCHGT